MRNQRRAGSRIRGAANVRRIKTRQEQLLIQTIEDDRRKGISIWQVIMFLPMYREVLIAITSDPFGPGLRVAIQAVVDEIVAMYPEWRDKLESLYAGACVLPCDLLNTSDEQFAAIITLPKDRFFAPTQLKEAGVRISSPDDGPDAIRMSDAIISAQNQLQAEIERAAESRKPSRPVVSGRRRP